MFAKINSTIDLDNAVNQKSAELNCELDNSMTYAEQADFYDSEADAPRNHDDAESLRKMAEILRAADSRWFELEQ